MTVRAAGGDVVAWSGTEHLLATVVDMLRILVWQNTDDGHKGRNQPSPLPRPGVDNPNETRLGRGSWSVAEMRHKLGWDRPRGARNGN